MPFPVSRREFLGQLALTGAALSNVDQNAEAAAGAGSGSPQIENDFLRAAFDTATGRLHVSRRGGARLLAGAVVRAHTSRGLRSTAEPRYQHAVEATRRRDALGEGSRLIVRCTDSERELDLELRVTLLDRRPAVVLEATGRNVASRPVVVESLEPLCAVPEAGGALHWPQVTKLLTNGAMYYDPGTVADFAAPAAEARRSWWNVGFFQGYDREGLVCGYLRNQQALGQVVVRRAGDAAISLTAESVLAKGCVLPPGQAVNSEPFMVNLAPDPYTALEEYAGTMGALQSARVGSVLNGWCDWFFAYEHITEEEMIRNAESAARTLKAYGLEYIQVDEGFQRWHGDWEGNDRFPHGMKWLADRIRALGLKPGIWLAPYVISEPTEVFQQHPEWLLRHPDGRLQRVGPWPSEDSDWARGENPKRYALDITHPGAAAWLADLFDTVANRWGYQMIKIDFVDWSLLSAHQYHDPTVSRAAAYRKGFEIMRRALGPDCHLQDCGPGPVTVGLLDSMRIELDQNYGFPPQAWRQYFLNPTSSAPAAAKRYYFHRRTWINDADHVCLQALTVPQAQAAATLIALTGGNVISGDRLPDLDPTRLEILKKILPAAGEGARPVDLFDTDCHTVFAVKVRRSFGEWTVVGVFNPEEGEVAERVLPLERLWLDPGRTYLAYDFWRERLQGEVQGTLRVRVPPASVTLLALHPKRGEPQVVSTDRHVLQGALELEDVGWNRDTQTLHGTSLGPEGTAHNVAVCLPESRPWKQGGAFLFHDFDGYTLKMVDANLLRLRVRFDHGPRVTWQIPLKDFLG